MISRNKLLLAGSIGVVVILTGIVFALLRGSNSTPAAVISPSATPSSNPTPNLEPGIGDNHDANVAEFEARYPALFHLPKENPYWSLQVDGPVTDGKLPITATIRYEMGTDAQAAVDKQRPFIEQFLASIGQQPDTYDLRISTDEIDTYVSR